jgi:hypothetical protein
MEYLKPHTEAWFAALSSGNRGQAEMTKQMISMSGKEDCCSVCGDEESVAYKVVGARFTDEIGATIRLCEECREIRRSTQGESYIRM